MDVHSPEKDSAAMDGQTARDDPGQGPFAVAHDGANAKNLSRLNPEREVLEARFMVGALDGDIPQIQDGRRPRGG
jgi:hypothetical protein